MKGALLMCGICGFMHKCEVNIEVLKGMSKTISYRGPDDEGIYLEKINIPKSVTDLNNSFQVGLAHNRLSILDISDLGHQPMISKNGNTVICYNGEIYNFKEIREELQRNGYHFISKCDTEVIIYAYEEWGMNCVEHFNGMFAISLWDREKKTLHLIRDRIGVKPLYYYFDGNIVIFGSELKPIMKYPAFNKKINYKSLSEYLSRQYITAPNTIFENTFKVEGGHYISFRINSENIIEKKDTEYWSVSKIVINQSNLYTFDYETEKRKLKELLIDSVSKRLISDVPVGCYLSGGYDSSLIAAIMRESSLSKINTFTIGFSEKEYDESFYAKEVARYLGVNHICRNCTVEDFKSVVDNLPDYFDEPMADSSQIACVILSQVAKQGGVSVVLSGDGGDELFCGYNKYSFLDRYSKYGKKLKVITSVFPPVKKIVFLRGGKIHKLFYADNIANIINTDYYIYDDIYHDLIKESWKNNKFEKFINFDLGDKTKFMYTDMITYLPDDVMAKVDRSSMAVSLESRSPFLDYRIVEKAIRMPETYKEYNGVSKRILKDIIYEYIPRDILDRPKRGFGVPIGKWLHNDFNRMTKGLLEEGYVRKQGIFNYNAIKRMINKMQFGRDITTEQHVWTIFCFQLWWERYMAR